MTLLLIFLVLLYVTLVAGSLFALLANRWRGEWFSRRSRYALWALCLVELVYMLRSPACIYLPWAPGAPAVRRLILGSDSQGRTYWLEAKEALAFAMGPRWWFEFNVHAPPGRAGLEWIGPTRFSMPPRSNVEVVRSDGSRAPLHCDGAQLDVAWPRDVIELQDGVFLLEARGGFRLDTVSGECTPVKSTGYAGSSQLEAEGMAPSGGPIRVEPIKPHTAAGAAEVVVAQAVVLDAQSGRALGSRPIRVPFDGTLSAVQFVRATPFDGGYWVMVGTGWESSKKRHIPERLARLYRLDRQLSSATEVGRFPWLGSMLIASRDGAFLFTLGGIYAHDGRLLEKSSLPFQTATWVGHQLIAVAEGGFLGRAVLPRRGVPRHPFGSPQHQQAKRHLLPASQLSAPGWRPFIPHFDKPDHWVLGGWDEAGGADTLLTRSIAVEAGVEP